MPSTTSSSVSADLASSTVMTPSLPTFAIAWAIISPISRWPLAEIVPTWAISSLVFTFLAWWGRSPTTWVTALSMPRLRSIGFMPAATRFMPSRTMAWARTVAVVVPSPAVSFAFEATSRSIWAPMFSSLSSSSISLATVTPSFVVRGAPNDFSMTTLRPFGPSVTFTAFARMSTPRSIFSRASAPKTTIFAAILSYLLNCLGKERGDGVLFRLQDAHDVAFLHDQQLFAVDRDFRAGPLAEQHAVFRLHIHRDDLIVITAGAFTDSHHDALLGLLFRGVGDDDPALGLFFFLDAANNDAIMQGTKFHSLCLFDQNRYLDLSMGSGREQAGGAMN